MTSARRTTKKAPAAAEASMLPDVRSNLNHDEGMIAYDDIQSELAEALRSIINRYELRRGSHLPSTIAVTSALRGEGVSLVSRSISSLIARETSQYVCWVDCSWLSPEQQPKETTGRAGLIDILADRANILSALQTSPDLPQLFSLRAGPVPESRRNMIARSPQFESLLSVLAAEFDHVIFDIPPILANAGGLAIVRRSDASLFVVRHRATSIAQFKRLVEATQPTPNLGVVLNHYRTNIPARLRRLLGD